MYLRFGAATLAAPTTQGPAERIGQGCSRPSAPRFSDSTNALCGREVQWNAQSDQRQSWVWISSPLHDVIPYALRAMPFTEERRGNWHKDPAALRSAMAEIATMFKGRNLVACGVLSRRSSGDLCIKSISGARIISEDGAIDIIDIADLAQWSERASELCERLISLGLGLKGSAWVRLRVFELHAVAKGPAPAA